MIRFSDVTLGYGRRAVLKGINLSVDRGAFMGIVGPNGSGKTTLLRAALGSLRPLEGEITRSEPRPTLGYVPQRDTLDSLFPLPVRDVVVMGCFGRLGAVARPGRPEHRDAAEALEHAGILDLSTKQFHSLSGGQKQRTLIARALAGKPDLLVLDEPTNGMDLDSEAGIMRLLVHLNRDHNMTVMMVSHLLNVVINAADSLVVVSETGVRAGRTSDIVTKPVLDDLYRCGVEIIEVGGRTVVLPAEQRGDIL